jgi:ribokinase
MSGYENNDKVGVLHHMRILNYGSLNIDFVYQVPHIVRPGETIHGGDFRTYAGGKGANQSVALARAGAEIWHAGKIGEDGLWLKDLLEQSGVHTEYIHEYSGPTGHTFIQVSPEGQNAIVLYTGGNYKNLPQEMDATLSCFSDGDYLVLQNEINLMAELIEKAHTKGLRICLNPAPFTENIKSWPLEKLELLIVNEIEAESLAGVQGNYESILDALVIKYPDVKILMTLGKEGSIYGRNTERFRVGIPALDLPVVDTTAAGDTYFGYFLKTMIAGKSIPQAMLTASRAAYLTVSRPGAMSSIPYAAEVKALAMESIRQEA